MVIFVYAANVTLWVTIILATTTGINSGYTLAGMLVALGFTFAQLFYNFLGTD